MKMFSGAVNFLESATGLDLDGDGDVGEEGGEAAPIGARMVNAAESATGLDLDGDGDVGEEGGEAAPIAAVGAVLVNAAVGAVLVNAAEYATDLDLDGDGDVGIIGVHPRRRRDESEPARAREHSERREKRADGRPGNRPSRQHARSSSRSTRTGRRTTATAERSGAAIAHTTGCAREASRPGTLWFDNGVEADALPEAVAQARGVCEETGAALAEATDALAAAEQAVADGEAALAEAQESVDTLTAKLEAEQQAVDECPDKEALEATLAECTAALEEAQGAMEGLEEADATPVEEAQAALDEAQAALDEAQGSVDSLTEEVAAAQAAVDECQSMEDLETALADAQGALEEATGAQEAAQAAAEETQGALDEASGGLEDLQGAVDEAQGALDEAQGALDEAQGALDEWEPEEDEEGEVVNEGDQEELQGAVDEAQGAVDEAQGAVDETQGALDEQQGAADEAQGTLDEQTAAAEEAQGAIDEAQAAVDAAQEAVDAAPDADAAQEALDEKSAELEEAQAALEECGTDEPQAALDEAAAAFEEAGAAFVEGQAAVEAATSANDEAQEAVDNCPDIDELNAAVEATTEALGDAQATVEETQAGLDEAQAALPEAQEAHAEADAAAGDALDALDDACEAAVEETNASLEEAAATLDTAAESPLQTELEAHNAELEEMTEALAQQQFLLERAEENLAAAEAAAAKQEELDGLEAELEELKTAYDEADASFAEADAASKEARANRQQLGDDIKEAKQALAEIQHKIDNAPPVEETQAALDDATAAREDKETELDDKKTELEDFQTALDDATAAQAEAADEAEGEETEGLTEGNEEAEAAVAEAQANVDTCTEEVAEIESSLEELKAAEAAAQAAVDEIGDFDAESAAQEAQEARAKVMDLDSEYQQAKDDLTEKRDAVKELKDARAETKSAYREARAPVLELRAEINAAPDMDEAQAAIDRANEAIAAADEERGAKEAQVEAFQEQVDEETAEIDRLANEHDHAADNVNSLLFFMKLEFDGPGDGEEYDDEDSDDDYSDSDEDSSSSDSSDSSSSSDDDDDDDDDEDAKAAKQKDKLAAKRKEKNKSKLALKSGASVSLCYYNQVVSVGLGRVKIKDASAVPGPDERLEILTPAPGIMAFQNIHGRFLSVSANSGKVSASKELGGGAMFTVVPLGNKIALRSSLGGFLAAAVETEVGETPENMLDGGWQVSWESGDSASLIIKGGEWELFGNKYQLDMSDPMAPSFEWPGKGELVRETFEVGPMPASGWQQVAKAWVDENQPDEGWVPESKSYGPDDVSAASMCTFRRMTYGEPEGSQSAEIDPANLAQLQQLGFQIKWTTDNDEKITWTRTIPDKGQLETAVCTGLVCRPAQADVIDPSVCFSIVRRSKKKYDLPISELPKVTPKLPPPPFVFEYEGEKKNIGTEFAQEAWTNSTYVLGQLKGSPKTVNVVAEARGKGALKLCLFNLDGAILEKKFNEDDMVDISSAPGTQLRIINAELKGLTSLNITGLAQELVVGNRLFVAGGASSIVGDTEPGVDQILTIMYAAMHVRGIESLGKVTPDGGLLDSGERSFDVNFSSSNNNLVCTQARKNDFLAVIMASPPGTGLTCSSAKVTVEYGPTKKFKQPAEDFEPVLDVVLAPEPKELEPPEGYSVLSTMTVDTDCALVNHTYCKMVISGEYSMFEQVRDGEMGPYEGPDVKKVGDVDTVRFTTDPEKPNNSFGISIDPLKSKHLYVSADIRVASALPLKDTVGFRLTTPTNGPPLPFTGCINSWIPSVTTQDRCYATFKNRQTVSIRSAGPGTTLSITNATLDGEDVTETVNELVEDMESGGQQLFCPGGIYEKLGRDIPRPFGKRGAAPVDSIFVVQYVSWTHVEFPISRPPGQSVLSLCLDGVPYKTMIDVANWRVYELESSDDADIPPLPKKDIFVNEQTNNPWDADEYAAFLMGKSPEDQFLERSRIKAGIEQGLYHIAERDAQKLRQAAKGLGTDDSALKALLISRVMEDGPGNKHMQAVDGAFQRMYDTSLAEMIRSETSGDYCTFLTSLVTPKAKLDAISFNKAMQGLGTDDDLLIELVCTRSNAEIVAARKAYAAMFDKDLMTEVADETSGDYKKLLLTVLQANQDERPDDAEIDDAECEAAAKAINDAIAGLGTDEDALIRVVCKVAPQLWAEDKIPAVYEATFGEPLLDAVGGDVGGGFGQALLMKMKKSKYYVWAELLKKAGPDKLGTDEDTIIRILTCCQSPGLTLKESVEFLGLIYEEVAGDPLADMLDSELSFNFGDSIAQLVEGPDSADPYTRFQKVSARWDMIDGTTTGTDWEYKDAHLFVLSWIALLDGYDIKKAMEGWGTDEDTLANILASRTQEQVSLANFCYAELYDGADLVTDIEGETSGDYSKFMNYLIREQDECDAIAFHRSIKGFGTNDDLLLLICCSLTARELAGAKRAYAALYGRVLTSDVHSDTSGDYRTALMQILRCQRSEKTTLSVAESKNYADMLYTAGEGLLLGTDEATFIDIFTSLSPAQLRLVEREYNELSLDVYPEGGPDSEGFVELGDDIAEYLTQLFGTELEDKDSRLVKAIKSEMSFNLQKCLLLLLRDPDEVKARMLMKAFKGWGTDEELVAYGIGASTKEELQKVSDTYDDLFGKSLVEVAASELDGMFEGDFQKAVVQYLTRDPVGCPPPSPASALCDEKELGRLREEASDALDFIAMEDAKRLRRACKGFGTNDTELIQIVTTRSKGQLARIDKMYRRKFDISIREQIVDECSGAYKDFLLAMVQDKSQVDALLFDKAMRGWGTSEQLLCELCATRTATELKAASKSYRRMFDKELITVVKDETSGHFENFLVRLLECTRDETNNVDEEAAAAAATALFEATHTEDGEESFFADKDAFVRTLARENPSQLAAISAAYEEQYDGTTLEALVDEKLSGDVEKVAKMMLKDRITLFCEMLNGAVSGWWNDKSIIMRILGSNPKSTIDQIQAKYPEMYEGVTLIESLSDELSGDFKRAVLSFLYTSNAEMMCPDLTAPMPNESPAVEAARLTVDLARLQDYVAHIDARNVHQACAGWGTDDKALIGTLTRRTKEQLAKLNAAYVYRYSITLISQIKDETIKLPFITNHYREFLINIVSDRGKIDAMALRQAIRGFGTDEALLNEICTTRTNAEIKAAKAMYIAMYERDVYLDIFEDTSGDYRSMLLSLIQCKRQENEFVSMQQMIRSWQSRKELDIGTHGRDDGPAVDFKEAGRVAELLYKAGEGKEDGAASKFTKHLCRYSPEMLQSVSVQYEQKYGKTLEDAMEAEVSGDFLDCCKMLIAPRLDVWTILLIKSFEGFGTDDTSTARILGSVDKTTVVALAYRYAELAGKPLIESLTDELSGDFLDATMSWVSAEASVGNEVVDAEAAAQLLEHELLCRENATQLAPGLKISLMSEFGCLVSGYSAEEGQDAKMPMMASSGSAGPWERFMIHTMAPNLVALQRTDNKMYVSVDEDGILTCDAEKPSENETFYVVIKDTRVALRSCYGKWWTAERDGDLFCTADSVDETELFKVMLRPTYADKFTGPLDTEFIQPTMVNVNRQLQEELDKSLDHIAQYDATTIHECCIGFGTDDDELINTLTSRTKAQLARVDNFYRLKYDMCIAEQIADECSGDYKTFLTSMCMSQSVVDATLIHEAMKGLGTDDDVLVELCCTRSNLEIKRMKEAYARMFGRPLIQVVRSETSGAYKKLLVRVLLGRRSEETTVSKKVAEQQAEQLHKAMSKRIADRDAIIDVFTKCAAVQLAEIDKIYLEKYGLGLEAAIDGAISSMVSSGFKRVCKTLIKDPITVFCELLNKAFEGWGTDEECVMRVLGGHDKQTVNKIRERYGVLYQKPLIEDLDNELSGDFKQAVIEWVVSEGVGEGPPPEKPASSLKNDMIEYFEDVSAERARLIQSNKAALEYIAYCDARVIRKACKGFGTNDSKLIDVLTTRTKDQLQKVDDAYVYNYGMTIVSQIKDETSGNYGDFLCAMVTDKPKFDAQQIHKAIRGWGTDEDLLTEIVCTRTNAELKRIKQAYYEIYEEDVTLAVIDDTSGDYARLLTRILQADRDEGGEETIDEGLAPEQATELVAAGEGKLGTDEEKFLDILCKHSPAHLAAVSAAYEEETGHSLKKGISEEMGMWGEGDFKHALTMLLFDRIQVFAKLLKKAFKGLGTDNKCCMRIIGGNDRATLNAISLAFEEMDGRTLEEALDSELSGDFKDSVIQWLTLDSLGLEDEKNRELLYQTGALEEGDERMKEAEKDPFDVIPERLAPSVLRVKNSQLLKVLDETLDMIADYDVKCIRECCEGMGTNDEELIYILTGRSKPQLERICKRYRVKYETTLAGQIGSECSFDYRRFLQSCVKDKAKLDAEMYYEAMHGGLTGIGTDEDLLIELVCTRTNEEILAAKSAYYHIYDVPLTSDIRSECSGDFKEVLISLLQGRRPVEDMPNELLAMGQAKTLYKKGVGKFFGTDEHAFISILTRSSAVQCKSIAEMYEKMFGQSLIDAIKSEMSGDLKKILCDLLTDPIELWAKALRAAFKGFGTNDDTVCRIVGGCNYVQLKQVQDKYFELYSRPLIEDIAEECSGDYKVAVISKCINEPLGEEDDMPEPNLTPLEDAMHDFYRLKNTLLRAQQFLVTIDAKRIKKACEGFGTNDTELIALLTSRTKDSLQKISDCYCERYGMTLVGQIKKECSFNYSTFLQSMVRDKSKVDALNFRKAMKGLGTDDDLLVELTCTRSNKELWEVKQAYKMIFDRDLVKDVKSETSGVYMKFLVRVLRCRRDESTSLCVADAEKAEEQADDLHKAAKKAKKSMMKRVLASGKDAYLDILTKVMPEQAALISAAYEEKYGCTLETLIEENMGWMYRDLRKACKAMIKPRLSVFADLLYKAFKGFGTDDSAVSRILGGNDKRMVKAIAIEYENRHPENETLVASLESELSGDFLKAAKAWVENSAIGMDDYPEVAPMHVESIPWDVTAANERLDVELEKNLDEIARRDAEKIFKACDGLGTDEAALIAVLTGRTKPQMERIDKFYQELYGMSVHEQVLDELSGDFKTFMLTLMRDECEADCYALNTAMEGLGTDELLITTILLNRSRVKVKEIIAKYQELFDKDLIEHVKSEVSGDYENFLVRILKGLKRSSKRINWNVAKNRATHIWNAGEATWGTDEEVFVNILSGSSDAQLMAIDQCYTELHSNTRRRTLAQSCKSEMSGDLRTICMAAAKPRIDRFCFLLKKAMDGVGTTESVLIHIVANESKKTVDQIIDRYDELYGVSLESHLDSEISGDFKKALMSWMFGDAIGEDVPPERHITPLDDDVMEYFRRRDTLRAAVYYIGLLDATKLRKATKGMGTDEAKLTEVIVSQTRDGLKRLDEQFVFRYDMTLVGLVRDETGGDYCKFLVAVIRDPSYSIAELFRSCVQGWGTDEKLLSEIICTSTNEQLQAAQKAYSAMYDRVLWRDVASDTSGSYRQLLLALLAGSRGNIDDWSPEDAAAQLTANKSLKLPSPTESTFIAVYALFSQEQLAEIAGVFEDASGGVSLADFIAEEGFSEDFVDLAVCLQTPPVNLMCAQLMNRFEEPEDSVGAMFKGLSDAMRADWRVIRTIGALPLPTVQEIAARYEEMAGAALVDVCGEQLSGDYGAAVLAWLNADPSVGMDDPAVAAMVDQGDKDSQPLDPEPTELFLKYDTDGTDSLSYRQLYELIDGEGFKVPASLDWFDSDADGEFSQEEFGRLYAVMMHKKAKMEERVAMGLSAEEVVVSLDPEVAAEEAEAAAAEIEDAAIDAADEAMTLLDETQAVEEEASPCCVIL